MPADGIATMANLSGLTKDDVQRLWEEARVNQARLASCSNHGFVPVGGLPAHRARYRCMHCRGEVNARDYRWYMCGRTHATDQLLDAGYRPPV